MKQVAITAATMFALVVGAGTAMAHPSGSHGRAHDVGSRVPQAHSHASANTLKTAKTPANVETRQGPATLSSAPPSGSYQWNRDYSNY